jgi:hypothetical protein
MRTEYTVTAISASADLCAAADYINRHAEAGGYTHDLRAIETEIASCAECIREGLRIDDVTAA